MDSLMAGVSYCEGGSELPPAGDGAVVVPRVSGARPSRVKATTWLPKGVRIVACPRMVYGMSPYPTAERTAAPTPAQLKRTGSVTTAEFDEDITIASICAALSGLGHEPVRIT